MAVALVDKIIGTVVPQQGPSVKLGDLISWSCTKTIEKRPVNTMRASPTPRGFRSGAVVVSGQMEIALQVEGLEYDFELARDTGEVFNFQVERGVGGKRKTVVEMQVTEIEETANGDGEHTLRVSFVASDYRTDR